MPVKEALLKIAERIQKAEMPGAAAGKIEELKKQGLIGDEEKDVLETAIKLLLSLKEKVGENNMGELAEKSGYGAPAKKNDDMEKATAEIEKMKGEIEKSKEALKKAEEEIEMKKAEIKKLGKEVPPPAAGPVEKSDGSYDYPKGWTPEQIAAIEPILKANKSHEVELKKIQKALDDEQTAKVEKEFIAKAAEIKSLSIKSDDLGKTLKLVNDKAGKDASDKIMSILKQADETVTKSKLFGEYGGTGEGECDALVQMETKAEAIMKSDAKITKAQAFDLVMKANPELYEQYVAQKQKRS